MPSVASRALTLVRAVARTVFHSRRVRARLDRACACACVGWTALLLGEAFFIRTFASNHRRVRLGVRVGVFGRVRDRTRERGVRCGGRGRDARVVFVPGGRGGVVRVVGGVFARVDTLFSVRSVPRTGAVEESGSVGCRRCCGCVTAPLTFVAGPVGYAWSAAAGGVREEDREREGDEEQDTMTSSSAGVAWRIGYVGVSTLCVMMILWIWFAPGSCSPLRAMDDAFQTRVGGVGPGEFSAQVSRPSRRVRRASCPRARGARSHRFRFTRRPERFLALHRIAGRVFFALSASMTYGYVLIHRRDLHFHATDFPTLARDEAGSRGIRTDVWDCPSCTSNTRAPRGSRTRRREPSPPSPRRREISPPTARGRARHLAAGLGIALQRVFIWVHHLCFDLARVRVFAAAPSSKTNPSATRSCGAAIAGLYCEWCVSFLTPQKNRNRRSV